MEGHSGWLAGGEGEVGKKLHDNEVMSRTMSVKGGRRRSVSEARQKPCLIMNSQTS